VAFVRVKRAGEEAISSIVFSFRTVLDFLAFLMLRREKDRGASKEWIYDLPVDAHKTPLCPFSK
jgi:hypothetical protein